MIFSTTLVLGLNQYHFGAGFRVWETWEKHETPTRSPNQVEILPYSSVRTILVPKTKKNVGIHCCPRIFPNIVDDADPIERSVCVTYRGFFVVSTIAE